MFITYIYIYGTRTRRTKLEKGEERKKDGKKKI